MSKAIYQRQIPTLIVSVLVVILIAEYFVLNSPLTDLKKEITRWGTIISLCVMLFANIMLLLRNIRTLVQRRAVRKELFRSASFLGAFLLFVVAAFASGPKLTTGDLYLLIWTSIYGTMSYGIDIGNHTVFTWYAVKRLHRVVVSVEGVVLLVSTFFSLFLYTTAVSPVLPQLDMTATWIKDILNTSAQRAALAAAAVGGVVLGIRALVGKEPGLVEREL